MDQLVTDEVAASGGDPVEPTTDAPETVVNQPAAEDISPTDSMYPDDQPAEESEGDVEGEQIGEGEGDEPVKPAITAPHSWKAEDKAKWEAIPPEAQEIIARRETEFARGVTEKAKEVEKVKTETVHQAAAEIATFRQQQSQIYQQLAAQIMPEPPNQELIYSQDPQHHVLYNQQRAFYESAVAQQQQLQLAAHHENAEAQRIQQDLESQAREADNAKLREAFPEYFDQTESGQKIQGDLKALASEIGYSELWDQRNAADVLALRKVAEWKSDAARWRSYDRNRRTPNGQYKAAQRALPPVTKPGASSARASASSDPVKLLYPND